MEKILFTLEHKNYKANIFYSKKDKCYWGKILVPGLVLFEAQKVAALKPEFLKTIEFYESK